MALTGTETLQVLPTQANGSPAATTVLTTTQDIANLSNDTDAVNTTIVRTSAAVTKNGSAAYANVTGLSYVVVPGTYDFELELPSTVASGTGGIKYAFNYTTAVLSALQAAATGFTASAVDVQNTTSTTAQADLFTQAAVVILTRIKGTMVVTTGGTIDVQMAQNTSNGSNTVALIGGSARFTRIA